LLFLQLLVIVFNLLYPVLKKKSPAFDYTTFKEEIAAFEAQLVADSIKQSQKKANKYQRIKNKKIIEYFDFNPNTISDKEWIELGLTTGQIRTIRNYQKRGGGFNKKEDLKRIYVISDKLYENLESYIVLPEEKVISKVHNKVEPDKILLSININCAEQDELELIPGIGPILSKRIIKYRDMLGGFYNSDQLLDVYGIDSSLYNKISKLIIVDESNLEKININTATFKSILKHPYLDYNMTKSLVEQRRKTGKFRSLEDVKKISRIFDSLYLILVPYLEI